MTSKNFKSVALPNVSVSIKPSSDGVRICSVHGPDVSNVTVSTEEAPALALAILEAAGYTGITASKEPDDLIEKAYSAIRLHIKEQERATAEAEAQAKLEAEAFNLYRTYIAVQGLMKAIGDWHALSERTKEEWLAVARRAREMRAEK